MVRTEAIPRDAPDPWAALLKGLCLWFAVLLALLATAATTAPAGAACMFRDLAHVPASYLLGIRSADQLREHPPRGAIFEARVASEICKARVHRGKIAAMNGPFRERSPNTPYRTYRQVPRNASGRSKVITPTDLNDPAVREEFLRQMNDVANLFLAPPDAPGPPPG